MILSSIVSIVGRSGKVPIPPLQGGLRSGEVARLRPASYKPDVFRITRNFMACEKGETNDTALAVLVGMFVMAYGLMLLPVAATLGLPLLIGGAGWFVFIVVDAIKDRRKPPH